MPHYLLTYTDFHGKAQMKVWTCRDTTQALTKATGIADCSRVGTVQEIGADLFRRFQAKQRRHPPTISNRKKKAL